MQTGQEPLILTLRMDADSQAFFDVRRARNFPPERNFLKAHLTLFHQLPDQVATRDVLERLHYQPFEMQVSGLKHLGGGVAYRIESSPLQLLHRELSGYFQADLIPQDRQPFGPHVVIQNKVTPEVSKQLLASLKDTFVPFTVKALGLDLWKYLGGPWRHSFSYNFEKSKK